MNVVGLLITVRIAFSFLHEQQYNLQTMCISFVDTTKTIVGIR